MATVKQTKKIMTKLMKQLDKLEDTLIEAQDKNVIQFDRTITSYSDTPAGKFSELYRSVLDKSQKQLAYAFLQELK